MDNCGHLISVCQFEFEFRIMIHDISSDISVIILKVLDYYWCDFLPAGEHYNSAGRNPKLFFETKSWEKGGVP
jgi:hypothetical protein